MLINYVPEEECRIAIVEDGSLEELYQERASAGSHVGNIYKGKVVGVEPSIQAAFVDFGLERNGFLHISDLHPMYFSGEAKDLSERIGKKTPRRDRPPIQRCLRRGQDVLVQVLKEGIGTKGPTVSSYLSIPGRFIVMMPNMERMGVSRKVEDDDARRQMREILDELKPPEGFGFIIRTAGVGRTKVELKRDLAYLQRLWKQIEQRMSRTRVGELYTESDLVIRTIRDVFSSDIQRVIVDHEKAARRARDFLAMASPRSTSKVMFYRDPVPLFHRYDLERQIENIHARVVPMPAGGSLVIDATEALVAIDVNSGKMRENRDAETTAYRTNVEAADEICRQLRLRDLGGVVVMDLIDMRSSQHRRQIEQRIRNNLKRDRARTRVGSISQFGIVEMTRQRMRPSLRTSHYTSCLHCQGAGQVRSPESVVLNVMRRLALTLLPGSVSQVELTVSPDVAFQLLNRKRSALVALESQFKKPVLVRVKDGGPVDYLQLVAFDARGGVLELDESAMPGEPDLVSVESLPDAAPRSAASKSDELDVYADVEDEPSPSGEALDDQPPTADADSRQQAESGEAPARPRRRRRRRRGGRGRGRASDSQESAVDEPKGDDGPAPAPEPGDSQAADPRSPQEPEPEPEPEPARSTSRRRRRPTKSAPSSEPPASEAEDQAAPDPSASDDSGDQSETRPRVRRRRRGGRSRRKKTATTTDGGTASPETS